MQTRISDPPTKIALVLYHDRVEFDRPKRARRDTGLASQRFGTHQLGSQLGVDRDRGRWAGFHTPCLNTLRAGIWHRRPTVLKLENPNARPRRVRLSLVLIGTPSRTADTRYKDWAPCEAFDALPDSPPRFDYLIDNRDTVPKKNVAVTPASPWNPIIPSLAKTLRRLGHSRLSIDLSDEYSALKPAKFSTIEGLLLTLRAALSRGTARAFQGESQIIVRPRDAAEVQAVVRRVRTQTPLVPQGGNTGLCGGAVANADQIILSLERLKQIRNIDPANNTMTVEAGCICRTSNDRT